MTRQERAQRVAEKLGLKVEGFTPGPWQRCAHLADPKIDEGCHCIASTRGSIWAANGEQIVCEIGETPDAQAEGSWTPPFDRSTVKANAALIAAAPTLWNHLLDLEEEVERLRKELEAKS